jgi:hypothetical protein
MTPFQSLLDLLDIIFVVCALGGANAGMRIRRTGCSHDTCIDVMAFVFFVFVFVLSFVFFLCIICRVQNTLSRGNAPHNIRFFILRDRRILAPDAPIIVSVQVNEQGPGWGVLVLVSVCLTEPRFPRFDEQLTHVRQAANRQDTEQAAAHDNQRDGPGGHLAAPSLPNLARCPRPPIHARTTAENARAASTAVIQRRAVHLRPSPDAHPAAAGGAHRHIMPTWSYTLLIKPDKRPTIIFATARDARRRFYAITRLEARKCPRGAHQ